MVLGPISEHGGDRAHAAARLRPADNAQCVHAAAEELLADLDRAQQLTAEWADERLGEALVSTAVDNCLSRLVMTGCWGRDNQLLSDQFWRLVQSRMSCGSLQDRARSKPRGYAGDFETLAQLCEMYECDDPLGRLFDRYFQHQSAVEAVRSRTEGIAHAIASRALSSAATPFQICSVGCGPGIDVQLAVRMIPEDRRRDLSIRLLDLDEEGLQHAAKRISPLLTPPQWSTVRENLYRLAERPLAEDIVLPSDFLFCTGLFDYLPDGPAVDLLSLFWRQIEPGGILMVGNFAPHNPSRAYMEWIGNWYLLYRTPEQLMGLADVAGIPVECRRITCDRTGVDLFLTAEKPD